MLLCEHVLTITWSETMTYLPIVLTVTIHYNNSNKNCSIESRDNKFHSHNFVLSIRVSVQTEVHFVNIVRSEDINVIIFWDTV